MAVAEFQKEFLFEFEGALQRVADRLARRLDEDFSPVARVIFVQRPPKVVAVVEDDGTWNHELLAGATDEIAAREAKLRAEQASKAPRERLFLGPNYDLRSVALDSVLDERIHRFDEATGSISITVPSQLVLNLDMKVLIQLPRQLIERHDVRVADGVAVSLVRDAFSALLRYALSEGRKFDPWPNLAEHAATFLREGADHLMRFSLFSGVRLATSGLFGWIDAISAMGYERRNARGTLVFAAGKPLRPQIQFAHPVPLSEVRWARKLIELSTDHTAVMVDDENHLAGLGETRADDFTVRLRGRHAWDFTLGAHVLFRATDGAVSLPKQRLDAVSFRRDLLRVLPEMPKPAAEEVWSLIEAIIGDASHGALIVVSEAAESESKRLQVNGTPIAPVHLTHEQAVSASNIDGAILLDALARCHALGVILDGSVTEATVGAPARGARFNSARRYVESSAARGAASVAVVLSEDGSIDVLPRLRPPVTRTKLKADCARFRELPPNDARARGQLALKLWSYAEYVDDETRTQLDEQLRLLRHFDRELELGSYDPHKSDVVDE